MLKKIFFCCFVFTLPGLVFNQSIENIKVNQAGKKIIIDYDLIEGSQGQQFTVKLFITENGGYSWSGPLTAITGDAGLGIKAGTSKRMIWDVQNESGREKLQGDSIAFKVQAVCYPYGFIPIHYSGVPCPDIPILTDTRDGQVYPTVQIGTQCWMQKNLNYVGIDSRCYENNNENCDFYGRLYTGWIRNICPYGWHLPSDEEWQTLVNFLGGSDVSGGKMKESGTGYWSATNVGATNSSGFTALPGGYYNWDYGGFKAIKELTIFWSATYSEGNRYWTYLLRSTDGVLYRSEGYKMNSYYVRCLKD